MDRNEVDRITNRHIGRLLGRVKDVHELPGIVVDDIKREMHRLKDDLVELFGKEPNANPHDQT